VCAPFINRGTRSFPAFRVGNSVEYFDLKTCPHKTCPFLHILDIGLIKEKFNGAMQFFKSKFENFETDRTYNLILESESACYIKIEPGFTSARKVLRTGGYLLVADYFVYYRNERGSPHLKSSHPMKAYLKAGEAAGFKLLKEYDNYNFI